MSTLRFGNRAKSIKNTPKQNKQRSVEELTLALESAEGNISKLNLLVQSLANELKKFKGDFNLEHLSPLSSSHSTPSLHIESSQPNDLSSSPSSSSSSSGTMTEGLELKIKELEEKLKEKEKELESSLEQQDLLQQSLQSKEEELEENSKKLLSLKENLQNTLSSHQKFKQENEILFNKVADQRVLLSKKEYEIQMATSELESLQSANQFSEKENLNLKEQLNSLLLSFQEKENLLQNLGNSLPSSHLTSPSSSSSPLPSHLTSSISSSSSSSKPNEEEQPSQSQQEEQKEKGQGSITTQSKNEDKPKEEKKEEISTEDLSLQKIKENLEEEFQKKVQENSSELEKMKTESFVQIHQTLENIKNKLKVNIKQYENEKQTLLKDLSENFNKTIDLKSLQKDALLKFKMLLAEKNTTELFKKNMVLEKNVKQINGARYQLIQQNQGLKLKLHQEEKTCKIKSDHISQIEKELQEMKDQHEIRENRDKEEIEKLQNKLEFYEKNSKGQFNLRTHSNIAVPIRGGSKRQNK